VRPYTEETEEGKLQTAIISFMNYAEKRTNISPEEMYIIVERQYGELPPKANFLKTTSIISAITLAYLFVILPITQGMGEVGNTLSIICFIFSAIFAFAALGEYLNIRNERLTEEIRRSKIKKEYSTLQTWYSEKEHINRQSTKDSNGKTTYPEDWSIRRRYVKARDGKCYLCRGARDNDRYYFYRARDGRHLNRSGKDLALHDQVHHIVPISKGGTHGLSNLVFLCNLCHEDQHSHLLRSRISTLERKSKQAHNPALKSFWSSRLTDTRNRLASLERHNSSPNALKLHVLAGITV
jgi:5-methylcytosine-specific restriction endonuclease McrA